MQVIQTNSLSKVPQITLGFWLVKIVATTLGETGGDTLSMTFKFGYALATAVFFPLFLVSVIAQIRAKSYHPSLYWAVIITTTTAGTTMADFADRSLGLGYPGGASILFLCVLAMLAAWRLVIGSVSASTITSAKVEVFYWATILFSNTLGTSLGDFTSDDSGLGYLGSAALFSGVLLVLAAVYAFSKLSRVWLFWAAFILTRPLGATLGDFLTKPLAHGGLNLSRIDSSAALAAVFCAGILLFARSAGGHPREPDTQLS
jgi:uncharacterized membrane-anchored protein